MKKRSVTIRGHRTSFSLEDEFWVQLNAIAKVREMPVARLITNVDEQRANGQNLSSALRLYVLDWLVSRSQRQ